MTASDLLTMSRRNTDGHWEGDLVDFVEPGLNRAAVNPSALDATSFSSLFTAVISYGPAKIEPIAATLAPMVATAMQKRSDPERKGNPGVADLTVGSLANLLACCGSADETAPLAALLPQFQTRKDDGQGFFWEQAFAALALQVTFLYRGLGGHEPDQSLPFTPGQRFGGNVQGFLRHLGGAVETGARFEDVRPAWDEFLANFRVHQDTLKLGRPTLFWIARVVHHDIGKQPLGGVAQWLHDTIVELADREV